jgi:hypothetical protein
MRFLTSSYDAVNAGSSRRATLHVPSGATARRQLRDPLRHSAGDLADMPADGLDVKPQAPRDLALLDARSVPLLIGLKKGH